MRTNTSRLARHCKFSSLLTFDSAQEKESVYKTANGTKMQKYWRITDAYGYSYSTKLEEAAELVYGEMYAVKGIVSQVRGGTFLNVEEITPFRDVSKKIKALHNSVDENLRAVGVDIDDLPY